ncbi:hypothetical protein C0J50_20436 [Silurus asotus]|uniref:Gypsy retrotransposon integrase-like protein 1 n=1 Tax=Silurus asotus TaxID=30991 RepID=A0AAD5ANG0_SILAS|nr:hypothetical protein C0J50_20436 [Silurus asotus]
MTLGLEAFIQRSIRVSQHLAAGKSPEVEPAQAMAAPTTPEPEPMQLGAQRLSWQERECRWAAGACLYCGERGHRVAQCPVRTPRRTACLELLQLRRQRGSQELAVQTIQGRPLGKGKVKYCAPPIILQVGVLHQEEIQLLVLEDSTVDVILGRPWLAKHSPACSWDPCNVLECSPASRQKCLRPLPTPLQTVLTLAATQVEGAPQPAQVEIPHDYQAFSDIFSEEAATQLPPHRPWDCAIDLKPGAKLPKGWVYPLSALEHQAMEGYIQQALRQGLLYPVLLPEKPRPSPGPQKHKRPSRSYARGSVLLCFSGILTPSSDLLSRWTHLSWAWGPPSPSIQGIPLNSIPAPNSQNWRFQPGFLRGKAKTLSWTPEAQRAFEELRTSFCTAPLLHHPDPQLPFVVEVDASFMGVGATLSQHSGNPPQLHPCTYFSKKLSPAELNYEIGNRELLAIKLALEEWRHWLEGAVHPFIVITKTFSTSDRTFVPPVCRQALLRAVHEISGSGPPGRRQTLRLVQGRYWWPGMSNTVAEFVRGCNICAIPKTPRHLPIGKLVPLPTPQRPWSHIIIEFVTDLPRSEGFTCVLVVVDRFSKACRFVPLRSLPTALETAEALFYHVFRNYGLPEEIVSDRGSQFTSHVWRAFFRLLGVTVNLSSGYHPQSNGQTEQKIQELGRYLRTYCRFLPWAEYAQNSLRQDTTGLTPFQCVLRFQPPLFPWSDEPSNVPAVDHWFRESVRIWDAAHTQLRRAVRETQRHADAHSVQQGSYII